MSTLGASFDEVSSRCDLAGLWGGALFVPPVEEGQRSAGTRVRDRFRYTGAREEWSEAIGEGPSARLQQATVLDLGPGLGCPPGSTTSTHSPN